MLTVTPGPDMVLVLRNGMRGGGWTAWATGLGCCAGIAIHAAAAVLGLSVLLATSAAAFTVIKLAGAAYLIWPAWPPCGRASGVTSRQAHRPTALRPSLRQQHEPPSGRACSPTC